MSQGFFDLKTKLVDSGQVFTAETLAGLAYTDLLRAGIGDAGAAACDLDLIQGETERRFRPWLDKVKTIADLEAVAGELREGGMLTDFVCYLLQHQPLGGLPQWEDQGARVKAFFEIKCLRAHADLAGERLTRLHSLLTSLPPQDAQEQNLLTILRFGVEACLGGIAARGSIELSVLRTRLKGYHHLTRCMYPEEVELCQAGVVQGHSCSAGCFLPLIHDQGAS